MGTEALPNLKRGVFKGVSPSPELYRLYFRDVDGHLVYVAEAEHVSRVLPSFYRFTTFVTDVKSAAKFNEESCSFVKSLLEEYYASMTDRPILLNIDRVL